MTAAANSSASSTTNNFAAWFAGSHVVDANGAPAVAFHGTNQLVGGDALTEFNLAMTGSTHGNCYKHGAAFFTDSPSNASGYAHSRLNMRYGADVKNYGGNVIPVYLSFQRPLVIDAGGKSFKSVIAAAIRRAGAAIKYDSIIVKNVVDSHVEGVDQVPSTTFIALDGRQVKSAIGNSGLYDAESHDICDRGDRAPLRERMRA